MFVRYSFRLLPALLLLACAAVQAEDKQSQNSATRPVPRKNLKFWMQRHERFVERAQKGDVDVLFLGDSITQGWEGSGKEAWKKYFAPLKAANFGIGGDQTQHVLWRITEGKELQGINPRAAVLMIGTNNMRGNSAEEIADGIKAIVAELRRQKPDMQILLLGIFPRSKEPNGMFRDKIKEVNRSIAKLDDGKHVHYLDIGKKFLEPDGSLSKDIMPDYLHLSAKGYEIESKAILPEVQKMLQK